MELFTVTEKMQKFFWQIEMFDVCTTGDTAHIGTIFKLCNEPCIKVWIVAAVKNIDAPMLTRVWQKRKHRIDVCRVTRGAHIERL
jgi:hypothetical protein